MNSNRKDIKKAIEYIKSTSGIEDLILTKEEIEKIKKALINKKVYENTISSITNKINEHEGEKDVRLW